MILPGPARPRTTLHFDTEGDAAEASGGLRALSLTTPVVRVVAGPGMLSFAEVPCFGLLIVGRERGAGLLIDHPSVSRVHASFALDEQGRIVVADLGSTNGTWRSGRRLAEAEVVEPGQTVGLGQVLLRVERLGAHEIAHLRRVAANIEAAFRDPLTRLTTRQWLVDTLPGMIEAHERDDLALSVLFIDIDHFKSINDTFGHATGDEVLRTVSGLVQSVVRPSDVAVRYGGEEISVILPETPGDLAVRVAERLRLVIAGHPWARHTLGSRVVTVSIGVAEYVPGEGAAAWFERADRAMYEAKQSGRNATRRG